ncbi:DNA-directed RNA polymerases I and III subunit RPAC2 [Pseudohyphozyma bogoriensis]|nr:DNA-directed RNA polymerases I and III subunit RPAC2 [Pseudohyphozyma bogoriensis]
MAEYYLEGNVALADKISVLPGGKVDASTYCILEEDHTLGNVLSPEVEFCGYSAPHPSEAKIHLRIQMYDGKSCLDALHAALNNLESLVESIQEAYTTSLASGDYEKLEDEPIDFESVNDKLWAQKEAAGLGSRAEFEAEKKRKEEEAKEAAKPKKGKAVKAGR